MLDRIESNFKSVPTLDTERRVPFGTQVKWSPSHIGIYNHFINIDIPTGNLIILTDDISYPYYNFSLKINRKYDMQEQHMQLSHLQNYPNVDQKPHWFGNWQLCYEADVDEVWHNTLSELHITTGIGSNGLFCKRKPYFDRNFKDSKKVKKLLETYGIPNTTLNNIGWEFTENDFLLRTLRGQFQILSGNIYEETNVDDLNAKMWLFNPISGIAMRISSEFFYNKWSDDFRNVGYPLIVTKIVDALGHSIQFSPSNSESPFKKFILSDDSGRKLFIELNECVTFLDVSKPGGKVRKYLISDVIDETKKDIKKCSKVIENDTFCGTSLPELKKICPTCESSYNSLHYTYNHFHLQFSKQQVPLLDEVKLPSTIGNRYVRYHYDNNEYPGVLTGIENSTGQKIQFEYIKYLEDNDERLNPRLKIKKIIIPEGITFSYDYNYFKSEVLVNIFKTGNINRKFKYKFIRDKTDSKRRYITLTEVKVKHGYIIDNHNKVVPRGEDNPQIVQNQTIYTNNGRFNVKEEIDPLNRKICYEYNDFNQVKMMCDFDNHRTDYIYDIPDKRYRSWAPNVKDPRRYDILFERRKNIQLNPNEGYEKKEVDIEVSYKYKKYDDKSSKEKGDHQIQSTHRIDSMIDERRKKWVYKYADKEDNKPLLPTLKISPKAIEIKYKFNNRGELETITDSYDNIHIYKYNNQGNIEEYLNPNKRVIKLKYYRCGNWLQTYTDQLNKNTEFKRDVDGRIINIIFPVSEKVKNIVNYEYYENGRLSKIINHRPKIPSDTLDINSPSLILIYDKLETTFGYSPLGKLNYLKNPKGLELIFQFDEAGRIYHWYHNINNPHYTKFIYDIAGQLEKLVNRKDKLSSYEYYKSGYLKSAKYPDWNDGSNDRNGKFVVYEYDYLGRPLKIKDTEISKQKKYMYVYDKAGNLIHCHNPDGFEINLNYDDDNRLEKVYDSDENYQLDIELDDLNRPKSLWDSNILDGSLLWEYEYEKQVGEIKKVLNLYKMKLPNIKLVSDFNYDEKNRLKDIKHSRASNPPISLYSQNFYYRDDDLLEEIQGDDRNKFSYDNIKQLIYEETENLFSDYDKAGNRLYRLDKTINPISEDNYNEYNEVNRLIEEKKLEIKYKYDENGNIHQAIYQDSPENPIQYYFDSLNKLRKIVNKIDRNEIYYLYDHNGRLVKRTVKDMNIRRTEETYFSYLISKPIFIKKNGDPYMILTWDTNGRLLRIRKYNTINNGNYCYSIFPIYNGLGDIIRYIDGDQNEVVKISYDSWGNILKLNDQSKLFEYWGYKGGITDRLSKNILFGARWFSPLNGRFIAEDPSTHSNPYLYGDINNLYRYADNSPVSFSDPTGLQSKKQMDWESVTMHDKEFYTDAYGSWLFSKKYGKVTAESRREFKLWYGHKDAIGPVGCWLLTIPEAIITVATGGATKFITTGSKIYGLVRTKFARFLLKGTIMTVIEAPVNVTTHVIEQELHGEEVTGLSIIEAATDFPLSNEKLQEKALEKAFEP